MAFKALVRSPMAIKGMVHIVIETMDASEKGNRPRADGRERLIISSHDAAVLSRELARAVNQARNQR